MSRRADPLSIDLPRPEADRPAWGKAGLIAAAGFAVGILWPRLTHTRIAPNPPNDNGSAAVIDPTPAKSAAPASSSAPTLPLPDPRTSSAKASEATLSVGPGIILNCRDGRDAVDDNCGALEFDPIAVPRIKALSECPAASGATGKLSIGFDVDFRKKAVKVLLGRSSTLPHEKAEALIRCADKAFDKLSLAEVPHEHRRYTVFYTATFAPTALPASATAPLAAPANSAPGPVAEGRAAGSTVSESPASGFATVGWDVAIVRDSPKTGAIVTRLLRGSKVKVIAHQGDWYKVQYGTAEGWVYRGTIGL